MKEASGAELTPAAKNLKEFSRAGKNPKLDQNIKQFLANREILAYIMKGVYKELEGYSLKEIESMIDGNPVVGGMDVSPHEKIAGTGVENYEAGEGNVRYDIRYSFNFPGEKGEEEKENVEFLFNLEAQNKMKPGYDIMKRAIYYCSRMISEQVESLRDPKEYDNLKKVHSIWLFPYQKANRSKDAELWEDSITSFNLRPEFVYGNFKGKCEYDMIEVTFICLADESENDMMDTLSRLLEADSDYKSKFRVMENAGISVTNKLEGELVEMCNLSEGIWEEGMEKGLAQGMEKGRAEGIAETKDEMILDMMADGIKAERAAKIAKVSVEYVEELKKRAS